MTSGANFLGGAKSRLLPPSIPFRFFGAAAAFHVALWVGLFLAADHVARFRGGVAPALAAVHVLVLGVLTCTAVGAALQLLPVATRRALAAFWPIKLIFWMLVPGLLVLIGGMYAARIDLLIAGAIATTAALLLFATLLADNLRRAASLPIVSAYGWAALVALLATILLGTALSVDFTSGFLPNHLAAAHAHVVLGGFGFMGMLALGFSHVLIPMFALSSTPPKGPATAGFVVAVAAVVLGTTAALTGARAVLALATVVGLTAAGIHLWLMHQTLKTGMRKRLGLSFVLIRASWVALPLSLVLGLAAGYGWLGPNGPALFGLLLLGGWLLTFALAILQRILPFLASMHASQAQRGGPMRLSELGASRPLAVHAVCHAAALVGLTAAITFDTVGGVRAASAIGFTGAVAFAVFTADVIRRLRPPVA